MDGLHALCWDLIRRESGARRLICEYVVPSDREAVGESVDAWKTVSCGVCGDTWRLSGYGMNTREVAAVRQALLAALVLAV